MANALIPAAHILFIRDEAEILLIRRFNTGFADGLYGLPAGHVEPGELPVAAAIREAMEEVGVTIAAEHLDIAHVTATPQRVSFFFRARQWIGEPENREPDKCDDIGWFALEALPDNIVPYIGVAIARIRAGERYSERDR